MRGYRWGRFQGWAIIALGLPLFLIAPFAKSAPLLLGGVFLMVEGAGLVGKKKYGLVLLYVNIVLAYAAGYVLPSEAGVMRWVFVLFLVIPGAFYYPKRYKEFGFSQTAEVAGPERMPVDYLKPMRDLTDEERTTILERLRRHGAPKEK